jgi:hypothetical protein
VPLNLLKSRTETFGFFVGITIGPPTPVGVACPYFVFYV